MVRACLNEPCVVFLTLILDGEGLGVVLVVFLRSSFNSSDIRVVNVT